MCATFPAHLILLLDQPHHICQKVQVIQLLITQLSPIFISSSLFSPNILLSTLSSNSPVYGLPLVSDTEFHTDKI
jgi:hypothetical protein